MPTAFEIASVSIRICYPLIANNDKLLMETTWCLTQTVVTVGRVPNKADIVIPVPTGIQIH